jgi:hypothetical protein
MDSHPFVHRSIDAIREYLDNVPEGGEMAGADRSEKHRWVHDALAHVSYEQLSRDDRGFVRQYVHRVTGYSRAQVERQISDYRSSLLPSATPLPLIEQKHSRFSWPLVTAVTVLLLLFGFLRGSERFTAAVLQQSSSSSSISSQFS